MLTYLLRRLNLLVFTTLIMLGLLYSAVLMMPGDPVVNLSGIQQPNLEQKSDVINTFRLDGDVVLGYWAFVKERLSGNLGLSLSSGLPVLHEVKSHLTASIELAVIAVMAALVTGIPAGVLAASHRGPAPKFLWGLSLVSFSLPVFWLAMLLVLTFGLQLDWLPPSGRLNLLYDVPHQTGFLLIDIMIWDVAWRWQALGDAVLHMILPMFALATLPSTIILRTIRMGMLQEMDKNYIKALQSRGLSRFRLVLFHALPNALAAMFRTLGLQIGPLVSAAVIVETVFDWPGLGNWVLHATYQRDYTGLQGGILTIALCIIVLTILMDVMQALFDPTSRKER